MMKSKLCSALILMVLSVPSFPTSAGPIEDSVLRAMDARARQRAAEKRFAQERENLLSLAAQIYKDCLALESLRLEAGELVKKAQAGDIQEDLLGKARLLDQQVLEARARIKKIADRDHASLDWTEIYTRMASLRSTLNTRLDDEEYRDTKQFQSELQQKIRWLERAMRCSP